MLWEGLWELAATGCFWDFSTVLEELTPFSMMEPERGQTEPTLYLPCYRFLGVLPRLQAPLGRREMPGNQRGHACVCQLLKLR